MQRTNISRKSIDVVVSRRSAVSHARKTSLLPSFPSSTILDYVSLHSANSSNWAALLSTWRHSTLLHTKPSTILYAKLNACLVSI